MMTKVLGRSVALALVALGAAYAAPLTHELRGAGDRVSGTADTQIGNAITGSFSHDLDTYAFGGFDYVTPPERTASEPARVRQPGSLLVLGLGLIGFGLARRRRQLV